jgi:GntR family transcriptional repressor for pyruvate dehydrogenase complex
MYKDIAPLKKVKISDEVTYALENIIAENNLSPGDKLPSQSELSEKLQVGTRSIREAIRTLESRGMV